MDYLFSAGVVRHDPQRFMGKTVYVPHFNRDAVEFASRERDESYPGIKTLLPFLKKTKTKKIQQTGIWRIFILALDACFWLHKVNSIVYCDSETIDCAILADFRRRFPASQNILSNV